MSRSTHTELINPAERFFEWKGDTGQLSYFDKARGEKGEDVMVSLPFSFLVLDQLSQVTGGVDKGGWVGYWSNAVRNLKTQPLTVRSQYGVVAHGLYEQIKNEKGMKYTKLVYIAYPDEERNFHLGCLRLRGAAFSAWLDFVRKHRNVYNGAFTIIGSEENQKGSTRYFEPTFDHNPNVTDKASAEADALDGVLQEYLTAYFANNGQVEAPDERIAEPIEAAEREPGDDGYEERMAGGYGIAGGNEMPPWEARDEELPPGDR